MHKTYTSAILVIGCLLLLYLAVSPLFSPYIVGTADGIAHKYRLVNFDHALSSGILHPRWMGSAVLGYGSPLFIFNYSVPYYIADAIYHTGVSIQTASQLYEALTIITAFGAMYLLASRLWGRWAGMVSALVYTFAPYHLHTIYSYEAWGEMFAFTFPPLIIYLLLSYIRIQEASHIRKKIFYTLTVITWVLFILTHNISSYISSPAIALLGFVATKMNKRTFMSISAVLLPVILLSAFFTLPAVLLTNTIKIPELMAKESALRFLYMIPLITQLRMSWSAVLGEPVVYQKFTIGIPIAVILCISIWKFIVFLRSRVISSTSRNNIFPPIAIMLLSILIASLFFVDPVSSVWYAFRPFQYALYPYRFLFLATFAGSVLAGYVSKKSFLSGICIITLSVLCGYPFAHPTLDVFSFPTSFFIQPQMLTYASPTLKNMGVEEFVPKGADVQFIGQAEQAYLTQRVLPQKFIIPEGAGSIGISEIKDESLSATINANQTLPLTISTFYYPNWKASVDGTTVPVSSDRYGRIVLSVPKGTHQIQLHFGYNTTEIVGIMISVAGIVVYIAALFFL